MLCVQVVLVPQDHVVPKVIQVHLVRQVRQVLQVCGDELPDKPDVQVSCNTVAPPSMGMGLRVTLSLSSHIVKQKVNDQEVNCAKFLRLTPKMLLTPLWNIEVKNKKMSSVKF